MLMLLLIQIFYISAQLAKADYRIVVAADEESLISMANSAQNITSTTSHVVGLNQIDIERDFFDCLVDYTSSLETHLSLRFFAESRQSNYVCNDSLCGPNRQSATEEVANAIIALKQHFGWKESILVTDNSYTELRTKLLSNEDFVSMTTLANDEGIKNFVIQQLRPAGLRSIFVAAEPLRATTLMYYAKMGLMDRGYLFVFVQRSCVHVISKVHDGVLCISSNPLADSIQNFELGAMEADCRQQPVKLSLVNILDGHRVIVGQFQEIWDIGNSIIFPDNSTNPPDNSPIPLYFGSNLLSPQLNTTIQHHMQQAAKLAFSIHKSSLNFEFNLSSIRCYNLNIHSYEACLTHAFNQRTLAWLVPYDETEALVAARTLAIAGNFTTMLGLVFNNEVSSKQDYPTFIRMFPDIQLAHGHRIALLLNYHRINFFFDSQISPQLTTIFDDVARKSGIEIVTPDFLRRLNDTNRSHYFSDAAKYLYNTDIRPVVLWLSLDDCGIMLQAMYEAGVRLEDVTVFAPGPGFSYLMHKIPSEDEFKVTEFSENTVTAFLSYFTGDKGLKVKNDLDISQIDYPEYACYSYDMAYFAIQVTEFAIYRGIDFYNATRMAEAFRLVTTIGCSGRIQINEDDNNRNSKQVILSQTVRTDSGLLNLRCIEIDLETKVIFNVYNPFYWSGNSTQTPKQNRLNYEICPYPIEWKRDNDKSVLVGALVSIAIMILSLASAGLLLLTQKKMPTMVSNQQFLVNSADILVAVCMLGDTLTLLAFIIAQNEVSFIVLEYVLGKALKQKEDFYDGGLNKLLSSLIGIISAWLLAVLLAFKGPAYFRTSLRWASAAFNLGFFSLTVVLGLIAFDCSKSYTEDDPDLDDAVADLDCFEYCWRKTHLIYAASVGLLLMAFIFATQALLPILLNKLKGLNLKLTSKFILVKSVFEVYSVVLFKLKDLFGFFTYSSLSAASLFGYAILTVRLKPSNIQTINNFYSTLLIDCLIYQIFTLASSLLLKHNFHVATWLLMGFAGLIIILLTGYSAYRLHQSFVKMKGRTSQWFSFAWSCKSVPPPGINKLSFHRLLPEDECLTLTQFAGDACRYQDMLDFSTSLLLKSDYLGDEIYKLFRVAVANLLKQKISSLTKLESFIEQEVNTTKEYKAKIKAEIIELIESLMILIQKRVETCPKDSKKLRKIIRVLDKCSVTLQKEYEIEELNSLLRKLSRLSETEVKLPVIDTSLRVEEVILSVTSDRE